MNRVQTSSMLLAGILTLALGALPPGHGQAPGRVMRVIDDATTGDRWLLELDAGKPGGPGRMVRIKNTAPQPGSELASTNAMALDRPVIRAGDGVIVEEHSPVVDARLEATALGPAAGGTEFKARLKIGGKIVCAWALAPGRAELAPELKAQP